jgi:hypothetical protein
MGKQKYFYFICTLAGQRAPGIWELKYLGKQAFVNYGRAIACIVLRERLFMQGFKSNNNDG